MLSPLPAIVKIASVMAAIPEDSPSAPTPAFHFGNALLQHRRSRVHDAGVDVALDLEVEQVRPVLRIVESVRRGLVDRHGHRLGGGFRFVAAVHGQGFHLHVVSPQCRSKPSLLHESIYQYIE